MSKEEEKKENKNDDDDETEKVSWYVAQQNKTANIIKKYNIGTLQLFISPEILSMTKKERKRIDKVYYKREYTFTPSESQKSQKDYEKELEFQNKQKEQKENIAKQAAVGNNIPPALPAPPPPLVAPPALPAPPRAVLPVAPVADLKRKQLMVGGGPFDSDFNDDRGRFYDRDRDRYREREVIDPYAGIGAKPTTSSSITTSSLLSRAAMDSEPFIASLIKFNNSGFPSNATIKARVDTFFSINLFKAFLKKLGEPIKLHGIDNQVISVDDIDVLNEPKNQKKDDSKKKVFETDQKTEGSFITNWYPSQEQKKLIGSVYAFIYTTPSEQEMKQASEIGKKIPQASMLMIKEGDNYRLIGGPVDNREKLYSGYGTPSVVSSKYNSVTEETTVSNQMNSEYRKVTTQSSLPAAVSNTGLRFIYEPESSNSKDVSVNANSEISKLKSVIYTRQVPNSQMDTIIESSRATSTDIVKVPITTLFNILSGKTQTLQLRLDLNPSTVTILKFLFRILEKQNLLSSISGQQKKKTGEIYDDRVEKLRAKLSESSLNELDAVIRHNIRFILDILFSTKTTFKYKGIEYIVDYLEWNNTFKQLKKILENYKVAYYIELELFLEKLEKGKLAIDRDRTLFSSCAVKGSQIKNFWRRNFLEQNWSKVGRQLKNSIKVKSTPSITDILPGFIKKALNVGSSQIMSQLNTGVNQISFVQYCLLGQEQMVQDFKSIDNSFAGVSWKNENSWSKRKEILFNAMDMCGSDVYCFQNVQCSLESYTTIVNSLTDAEKETLEDVTTTSKQSDRIKIHRKVVNQLLEKVDDSLNVVAQIYERYKQEYFFVYFFEQNYIDGTLTIMDKKTALGNLTMFKSDKFELKDETDIRMGAFISKNKKTIESINKIDAIYSNTSFATVTYCTFKGGVYTKQSSLPGQIPGSLSSSPVKMTTASTATPSMRSNLPGIQGYSGTIKVSDADDMIPEEGNKGDDVQGIKDYEEEPGQSISPTPGDKLVQVGGGDGDEEWYNQDNSEQVGLFSGLFGNTAIGKQTKVKPEAEPCKKYMNPNYIPGGQIFGIINIKIETAETLKRIEAKQVAAIIPVKSSKSTNPATPTTPATTDTKITKQMLEVLLVAAFISKFRSRYYLSSSTDVNPYFMAGDFNFDIPYDQQISKSDITRVYFKAPALALLLTRSNNAFKPENYPSISGYSKQITDFIKMCKILTYLYGGIGKNGRLRLNGYTNSQTLPNMFGHKYSLTNPDKINKSEFIFTTGKLLLCPKEEMNKIVNSDSSDGLPVYPNKSNPSNSEAIGGVFDLDTVFVNQVITQVAKSEVEQQQNQQVALQDEAKRSLVEQLTGRPIGREDPSSYPRPRSSSPSQRIVSDGSVEGKVEGKVEAIVEPEEIPDWTQSTSGKPITASVKLVPDAVQIAGEDLKKLYSYEYTASKADTVKGSPYKKSVFICETGKPDYNYLTSLEMANWEANKDKIYSDHSPIMYNINNTNNDQCGQQLATATSGSSGMSGGEGGYDVEGIMNGGAFPAEIKLITWNIASHGGEVKDKDNALFYFHKFNGKLKEGIEHYKSRLANNARAIRDMMKGGYDYALLQEGPTYALESSLNKEEAKASASLEKEEVTVEPFKYKELLTTSIKNNEGSAGGDGSVNLDVVLSEITDDTKYFGEFYLVVNKNTVSVEEIKSLGFLIKGDKNIFSNDEAATIFNSIIQMVQQQKVPNYEEKFITKDCSRLWFFVNSKSKQIVTSTHLSLSEENTPKMYERQQQVYILLNMVVSYFRQDPIYREYDIVFSGDFNINLLQPFPTDVKPTFLKCNSVVGQQTFIYTSKNNAPSSFGGENEAKYNPTNIDFTVFYPKVRPRPGVLTKKVGFGASSSQSSLPSPTSLSLLSSVSSTQRTVKVSKITYYTQKEIFKALEVTPPATNLLDNNVSVINTDYNMTYAGLGIMPPGSATLLYIGDKPLNNISYNHPTATPTSASSVTVKYMIQASPGKSGTGDLITRYALSNSVMNSLILATLNGVKNIIFPFIGGEIFFKKLEAVELAAGIVHSKTEHAKMLLKGVTDFYEFIKVNKIGSTLEKIYFCPWGKEEVDALYSAKSYVSSSSSSSSSSSIGKVLTILQGKFNLIDETINLAKRSIPVLIDAIVNAANVELTFGSGVSSMCNAAIGQDASKQQKLYEIKKQFTDAFKKYIKQKNDDTLQVSSIATIAKKIRNNTLLEMGVPRGYVTTQGGDTYDVGIEEGNSIVIKRIDDLKLNSFELTKEENKFIHGIPAGSSLFYYDIKRKDSKNNYVKCWFSFNTSTFRTGFDKIDSKYRHQVFNPTGSDGMVVWLDTSNTAKLLTPFNETQKKEIGKVINDCISNPESSYVDVVKNYINEILDSYKRGSTYLNDKLKDKIIELAKQINMQVPDGITSWEDIKGWTADYVAPPSAAVLPSVSPAAPVTVTSSTKKSTITQINGIKNRATVADFKSAHNKGVIQNSKIPGGVDETILYTVDGSTFKQALQEINEGSKTTHWMWYIFPSDLKVKTPCSTFFRLGPYATDDPIGKTTLIISDYLKDNDLMKNYMIITEALYDKVDEILQDDDSGTKKTPQEILKKIMGSNTDYLKLKRSIKNFYKPLKTKINSTSTSSGGASFIKKMNVLNFILNDIIDPDYNIEDDKKVEIEDGYYRVLEEEAESSVKSDTVTALPEDADKTIKPSEADKEKEEEKEKEKEDTKDVDADEDGILEPMLKLETTANTRILSLEQILKLMIPNIKNNVFIITGGSFNPPHNGHIKMFELAHDKLVSDKDKSADATKEVKGYYGIMVVATRKHIMTKTSDEAEILNSGDRIKLCKLACDSYQWKNDKFNSNNMLILDEPNDNPTKLILSKIKKILDIVSKNSPDKEESMQKIKIENLFYLCGSDFFIKWYSLSSRYSVICLLRQSEKDEIDEIKESIVQFTEYGNPYLKKLLLTEDSEEYDLSSSVIRDNIYSLLKVPSGMSATNIQDGIIKSIGLPVYCYLKYLNYLIQNKYYGKRCEPDVKLSEEIKSVSEISITADGDGSEGASGEGDGDSSYSFEKSDIPEKYKNIFYTSINKITIFNSRTIENGKEFDTNISLLLLCESDSIDEKNLKKVIDYLKNIYNEGVYYILNDFVYFKKYLTKDKCFITDLFLHGDSNINLLEKIPLLSTRQFNDTYLSETNDNTIELIKNKEEYLNTIDTSDYTYYDGKKITKEIVDDILGFLYDSERYNLYLYLIDTKMPLEGKKILVKLYAIIVKNNSLTIDIIVEKINENLKFVVSGVKKDAMFLSKKGITSSTIVGPTEKGPEHLLEAVNYVKQKSNGDGNCFYNSIGMLSSSYMVMQEEYDKYVKMTLKEKYDTQLKEQIRVRTELAAFFKKIYDLIKNTVDKNSDQYKNSSIIKYIMRNGEKGFKYVAKIASPISPRYYGSDSEIFFASLFYLQPIVTVTGISEVTEFNIFYWDSYTIDGVIFNDYINQEGDKDINLKKVIDFLADKSKEKIYDKDETYLFLFNYPTSYFLVGGRGHWSYAVNISLLSARGDASGEEFGGGGYDKKVTTYNLRFTKKIKNKYYKKDALSSSLKTTKKHKKTRRANRNKNNKDNKDNKDNILKNKKHIKKTIKQSNGL